MKQTIVSPNGSPTANLAINKSRVKIYNKTGQMPTYYLEKGQEFAIELFNPTTNTVLAKIELNGKSIAQGGLVLRPGERVFLERYIDIAKKFKFDTYEVSNTSEVQKAIADNGDLKVEFFNETVPFNTYYCPPIPMNGFFNSGTVYGGTGSYYNDSIGLTTNNMNLTSTNNCNGSYTTTGILNLEPLKEIKTRSFGKKTKSIETGRVEMGESSSQKLTTVSKEFNNYPFHTIEYKLLPLSQKVNTVNDLQVKRYCTNCGSKSKPNFKFCPNCGSKA